MIVRSFFSYEVAAGVNVNSIGNVGVETVFGSKSDCLNHCRVEHLNRKWKKWRVR